MEKSKISEITSVSILDNGAFFIHHPDGSQWGFTPEESSKMFLFLVAYFKPELTQMKERPEEPQFVPLRDFHAAAALQGLLMTNPKLDTEKMLEQLSIKSFAIADAMMERGRR